MVRIAAVGDVHCRVGDEGRFRRHYAGLSDKADILILPGDLTGVGAVEEAELLLRELSDVDIPIVAVLGNHDFHSRQEEALAEALVRGGVCLLDGNAEVMTIRGCRLGLTGAKGFAGGFAPWLLTEFGECEMALWVDTVKGEQAKVEQGLSQLSVGESDCDVRVVVLHYSPIRETLQGEPVELWPFLGSSRLLEPIEKYGADLVLHGHAHHGSETGSTPAGIPVHNVALPVIKRPYALFELGKKVAEPSLSTASED